MTDLCLEEEKLELSEVKNNVTKVLKLDVKGHSLEKNVMPENKIPRRL